MSSIVNDRNLRKKEPINTYEESKSVKNEEQNKRSSAFEIIALTHKIAACIPCIGAEPIDVTKIISKVEDSSVEKSVKERLAYRKKLIRYLKNIIDNTNDEMKGKQGLIEHSANSNSYYWHSALAKADFKSSLIHNDMTENRALAFYMIEKNLHFLPPSVKNELDIDFILSADYFKKHSKPITINSPSPWINPEDDWKDKLSFHPSGYPLEPNPIDEKILNTIYKVIQERKPITFKYPSIHKSIDGNLTISPQQLKYQNHQLLLLGLIHGQNELKYFSVARISELSEANKNEFFIDKNIEALYTPFQFRARVHKWVKNYFENIPLHKDQTFSDHRKDTYILEATILLPKHFKHDGQDTFYFANMLGIFADAMEVLEPPCLRQEMIRRANQHRSLYLTDEDSVDVIKRSPHETSEKLTE